MVRYILDLAQELSALDSWLLTSNGCYCCLECHEDDQAPFGEVSGSERLLENRLRRFSIQPASLQSKQMHPFA
jgi:hypothetical protein